LANNSLAVAAEDNSGGMAENSHDLNASGALNVHEERVGSLNKTLQLVAASLIILTGVKKVFLELVLLNHLVKSLEAGPIPASDSHDCQCRHATVIAAGSSLLLLPSLACRGLP